MGLIPLGNGIYRVTGIYRSPITGRYVTPKDKEKTMEEFEEPIIRSNSTGKVLSFKDKLEYLTDREINVELVKQQSIANLLKLWESGIVAGKERQRLANDLKRELGYGEWV